MSDSYAFLAIFIIKFMPYFVNKNKLSLLNYL